jgi:large subunit ribosomal protein L15
VANKKTSGAARVGLENLAPPPGSHRERKRLGRGPGSGTGKTAGKGHKGIKARAGHHGPGGNKPAFEGGQMPMTRRIPKRGFHNPARVESQIVRLGDLEAVTGAGAINADVLLKSGLIARKGGPPKVLANGRITRAITVSGVTVSKGARAAIEAAGGRVEE